MNLCLIFLKYLERYYNYNYKLKLNFPFINPIKINNIIVIIFVVVVVCYYY